MKESQKAYYAGIVDGEGHLSIRKDSSSGYAKYSVVIKISQVDQKLGKSLKECFGGSLTTSSLPSGKTVYIWLPYGRICIKNFLLCVIPYLRIKTKQAKIIYKFLDIQGKQPNKRDSLYRRVQIANNQVFRYNQWRHVDSHIKSYLAGIFDAEGHQYENKNNGALIVGITNNNQKLCFLAHSLYGGHVRLKRRKTSSRWADTYDWILVAKSATKQFLLDILPYLIVKKSRALNSLEYLRRKTFEIPRD
jgi:hypothetical protein